MQLRILVLAMVLAGLAGCAEPPVRGDAAYDTIGREFDVAVTQRAKPAPSDTVSQALLPPLVVEMPTVEVGRPLDQRFDLNVNNAPANQVFMAIVSGTRYSMVVHPDVRDPVSVNLKDVTVMEALDTLRDLYGYEYRIQGNRISVHPISMQTRVFKVNYLQASRVGRSEVRVSSGSITDAPGSQGGAAGTSSAAPGSSTGTPPQRLTESTRVTTSSDSDFWGDIVKSLGAIVGRDGGRSVTVNAQSGVIVVRALPADLRAVESFLKAMQLIVERQVMLEAKILEVTLRDGYEVGINWAAFRDGNTLAAGGVVRPGSRISNSGPLATPTGRLPDGSPDPASTFAATLGGVGAALTAGAAAPDGRLPPRKVCSSSHLFRTSRAFRLPLHPISM